MTEPDPLTTVSPTNAAMAFAATRVPMAQAGERAGEVRDRLVGGERFESASEIAVLDIDELVGLIQIEDLLAAASEVPVISLMDPDPPVIAPGSDQEAAAFQGGRTPRKQPRRRRRRRAIPRIDPCPSHARSPARRAPRGLGPAQRIPPPIGSCPRLEQGGIGTQVLASLPLAARRPCGSAGRRRPRCRFRGRARLPSRARLLHPRNRLHRRMRWARRPRPWSSGGSRLVSRWQG